ncbi:YigZ family protein [Microbacterium sp. NPDC077644]|uniref:IMPACT family protein n=1 Tax=Microbacterium sp. NPDC077644 TaxID=3155055 RepID=UPI00344BAD5A
MSGSHPSTIARAVDHELLVKKSRFIARIAPVSSPEDADAVIAAVRKRAWDARHHCSAQITGPLGERARSSDDGEPSGTAGVSMLEVLRRRELTDVVAVVTRYFGGVKLGAGGLVRAYSSSVSEALDLATVLDRRMLTAVEVSVPYVDAGRFDNLLREWVHSRGGVLDDPVYAAAASSFVVWVRPEAVPELAAAIAEASAGAVTARSTGVEKLIDVPRGAP